MFQNFLAFSFPYLIVLLISIVLIISLLVNSKRKNLNRSEVITATLFFIILFPIGTKGVYESYSDIYKNGTSEAIVKIISENDNVGNHSSYTIVNTDNGKYYNTKFELEEGLKYKIEYFEKTKYIKNVQSLEK